MQQNDGGPAFPTENEAQTGPNRYHYQGMSLRDWFAGQALANEYAQDNTDPDKVAEWTYSVADSMLIQRAKVSDKPATVAPPSDTRTPSRPVCEECDEEMHPGTLPGGLDVWCCDRCGWSFDAEDEPTADRQQDPPPSHNRTTPGGVRVVWTEEAAETVLDGHDALPFLRMEVGRETLITALSAAIDEGWLTTESVDLFAARLGLTLSDGGET